VDTSSPSNASYRRLRSPPTASQGDGDGELGSNLHGPIITLGNWAMVVEGGIEYARRQLITGVNHIIPGLCESIARYASDIESQVNKGIWVDTMSSKLF